MPKDKKIAFGDNFERFSVVSSSTSLRTNGERSRTIRKVFYTFLHHKKQTIHLIALIILAALAFSNTLGNDFIWDDKDLIVSNKYVRNLAQAPFLFTPAYWKYYHPGTKGVYRPITALTFALDYALWKLKPFGYHLTNLLFQIANVILIYFLARRLLNSQKERGEVKSFFGYLIDPAFMAAVFFALHPIHTESVAWIKNRSDIFSLFFFLAALCFFIRHITANKPHKGIGQYVLALFCFGLGLLAKEMAITLPAVLLAFIFCFVPADRRGSCVVKTLPFFGLALIYFIFGRSISASLASAAPAPAISFYTHILIVVKTLGYYATLLTFPIRLNAERIFSIPHTFYEPAVFLSAVFGLILLVMAVKTFTASRAAGFAWLWILLTISPAANIIFIANRPIAEQRLYIPSVGFCIILAMLLNKTYTLPGEGRAEGTLRKLSIIFYIILVTLYFSVTFIRNQDWRDSLTFWTKTAQSSPTSDRANYNLGTAYLYARNWDKAILFYKRAIALGLDVYNNLANAYCLSGNSQEAIATFKKAIEFNPGFVDAYNNLGIVYQALGETEEAISLYKKAMEINPDHPSAYNNLGTIYESLEKYEEAIACYQSALERNLQSAEVYYNLGNAYNAIGKLPEAVLSYKEAIRLNPNIAQVHNNLAISYYYLKQYPEALKYLKKARALGLNNSELQEALAPFQKRLPNR